MGLGKGRGTGGNPLWFILWLLVLIFIAWIVSAICAFLYIIVSLFTPCIPALNDVADFLMKGVQFVHTCSQNMIDCKPMC